MTPNIIKPGCKRKFAIPVPYDIIRTNVKIYQEGKKMKKVYLTITILVILASSVYGCSPAATTTTQSPATVTTVSATSTSPVLVTTFSAPTEQIINAASSLVVPANGVYVQAGKHLNLSWASNNNLNSYIFNSAQYNNFLKSNDVSAFIKSGYGSQGSITVTAPDSDTYYGVIFNAVASGGPSLQLYTAVFTEQ